MIIECKNCLKKFNVKESDIPSNGRTVQCSNCSSKWLQLPITSLKKKISIQAIKKPKKSLPVKEIVNKKNLDQVIEASDGNTYKFLGSQWAIELPSGKMGRLATKKISKELNNLAGRNLVNNNKKKIDLNDTLENYNENKGKVGIFSYLIVLLFFVSAIILFLDTFKSQLMVFWPNLDKYLLYVFENLNNIYVIIKDLFNSYK